MASHSLSGMGRKPQNPALVCLPNLAIKKSAPPTAATDAGAVLTREDSRASTPLRSRRVSAKERGDGIDCLPFIFKGNVALNVLVFFQQGDEGCPVVGRHPRNHHGIKAPA